MNPAMQTALKDRPGWRFELIIEGLDQPRPLDPSQIENCIGEADILHRSGHFVAALLLLWSGIEGILRLIAIRENLELESAAPVYLVQRLYTLGLLARDQYHVLDEAIRLRNPASHGFQTLVTSKDLAALEETARQLLTEMNQPA